MSSDLVVRSMALIWTLVFGFIGELACLSGLKFRITDMILLEMDWRVRRSVPRQFKVAVMNRASLETGHSDTVSTNSRGHTHLCSSWKTLRSLSSSPDASGSSFDGGIIG